MGKTETENATVLLTLAVDPELRRWGVLAPGQELEVWSDKAAAGQTAAGAAEQRIAPGSTVPSADSGSSVTADGRQKLTFAEISTRAQLATHPQPSELRLLSARGGPLGKRDSMRLAACWFGDQYRAAVVAERAKGHEADRDDVNVLLDGERWPVVEDSRLSTTTDKDGAPLRFTLQAWLSDGEESDLHPWMIVGHRVGAPLSLELGDHTVVACLVECFRREQAGTGILALVRPS